MKYRIHTDVLERLGDSFINGSTIEDACLSAGIGITTLHRHRLRSEDFNEWVGIVMKRGEEKRIYKTRQKAKNTKELMRNLNG